MKKIKLSQNKYTLVDDEDFDWLNQWKWYLNNSGYAQRSEHISLAYKHKNILMHRLINKTPVGLHTDHINHNPLDNQKNNLRTVTLQQNHFNMKIFKNNSSGFKGVAWSKKYDKWRARIMINGKDINLGYFKILEDAILTRLMADKKYFGEFASPINYEI